MQRTIHQKRCRLSLSLLATGLLALPTEAGDAPVLPQDVAELLQEHCMQCHGGDVQEGGLRVDSPVHVLRGGDSGEPTVVPGESERSHLIARVTSADAAVRMPPNAEPLDAQQIQLLRTWIDQADSWQPAAEILAGDQLQHWSFHPVVRPSLPQSTFPHPIDAFVSQRLQEAGLEMAPPASRRKLIRRLFLVMHGLPPTPARIRSFLDDTRADAWEQLVDEVLESGHYGERWATFWLDLVRFAETDGFETNRERPHAWHYRDWVIQALNTDKAYDRFVIEQLAGDAFGEHPATGFLVAGPHDIVKGQDKQLGLMQRQDELDGIISSTGATFLGLTLGCARCHNHKFDPVLQKDYYALQAVFAGVNYANRELPAGADLAQQLAAVDEHIRQLRDELLSHVRPVPARFQLLDDEALAGPLSPGVKYLVEPSGTQRNDVAPKTTSGDAGRRHAATAVSTVWTPEQNTAVAVWKPFTSGLHRIWLSWSAGPGTHCQDAVYWLDQDGDPDTQDDRTQLAVVNQQQAASAEAANGAASWSGFLNAGIHMLNGRSGIVLESGRTGSTITADAVLLESPDAADRRTPAPSAPPIRPPVTATRNVDTFAPVMAQFARFVIHRSSSAQPCLDELEVYSGQHNAGLASAGAQATSSGNFVHPLHRLEHINDGNYGNSHSWIAASAKNAWVQLQLAEAKLIDRIVWSRDRRGQYTDRLPLDYEIQLSRDGVDWQTVAASSDRLPASSLRRDLEFDATDLADDDKRDADQKIRELHSLAAHRAEITKPQQVWAGQFQHPEPTWRLYRGDPMAPRERVAPGAVHALTSLGLDTEAPEQSRRLALARWIAAADNPLTSRVIVNRIWQHHFGTGIVDTPSDFGRNGSRPTHPQLLDWLASEFVAGQWSMKRLHRLILTSATWQQDSVPRSSAITLDADSRLLWRYPPRRLEAEAIRDSVLAVSGHLNRQAGGPGFSAFEVALENVRHYFPKTTFTEDDWRRMIYMTKVRQERDAVFGTFDCPDCSQLVPTRSRSTTPLQAMGLLNSQFMMQQTQFFADRLAEESNQPDVRIYRAWELCFGRPPDLAETELARQAIADSGWREFARAMLNASEFVFIP